MRPMCQCDNCGKRWREDRLHAPSDLYDRLTPGAEVPAGECPSCGALAYVDKDPTWLVVYHTEGHDPDWFRYTSKQMRSEDVIKRALGKYEGSCPDAINITIHTQLSGSAASFKEIFK